MTLTRFVRGKATDSKWPTLTASDNGEKVTPQTRKGSSLLAHADKWETGPLGLATQTGGESGSPQEGRRQRLNPAFVEALMGLPKGFSTPMTGCGASGMRSFLSRQRRLLASLLGG